MYLSFGFWLHRSFQQWSKDILSIWLKVYTTLEQF